ncbi:MAG: transglutaminase family protein [Myxococcaceae bacterium]|nr:transglutaminase family protein [Myxococcaceae bacterium]MCA3013416.1 transglutaminase family protein [Myxococcaceae bacterium]
MKPYALGQPPGRAQLLDALAHTPARLDLVALAVARLVDAHVDDAAAFEALDALGARVEHRLSARSGPGRGGLDALVSVLAGDEGFAGDAQRTSDPANSSLPQVLTRRRGLPITLSVIYAEVGRRAGLTVDGIGLPGHFIARLDDEYFDPFGGGRRLSVDDCRRLVERAQATFSPRHLEPVPATAIAWRMVNNLKGVWLQRAETERALQAVDLLLAMHPNHPAELRLRASLLVDLGAFGAAIADLERCRTLSTDRDDLLGLARAIEALRVKVGQLH